MYSHCTRCRRAVLSANLVVVDGKAYGRTCAAKVGDLLVQPQRRAQVMPRTRRPRGDARQLQLEVAP